MCFYYWALCISAGIVVLQQIRTLNSLAWLAGTSALAIVVAMVLTLIDFALYDSDDAPEVTYEWPAPHVGFLAAYGSTASFIFAYQGQSIFFEIMREMREPSQFWISVSSANLFMMVVYITIVCLCYHYKGDHLSDFLPANVVNPHIRQAVGALVAFNLFSSYLLTNVPLALAWHERLAPETARDFESFRGRLHWFALTGGILTFAFIVANAIPFFGSFQSIIGAALGAPILFGWPPFFFLQASRRYGAPVTNLDWCMCNLFIYVIMPACFAIGLYSALKGLWDEWANNSAPFSCNPTNTSG